MLQRIAVVIINYSLGGLFSAPIRLYYICHLNFFHVPVFEKWWIHFFIHRDLFYHECDLPCS